MREKKILLGLLLFAPFLAANRGCEKKDLQHPPVDAETACADCHEDGRTRSTKPEGHDLAWKKDHGKWIGRYGLSPDSTCLICHKESTCTACHQQEAPLDHNAFWRLKGHGLAVGLDRSRCFACHRSVDFCERCHANTPPISHTSSWGAPSNNHCLSCHFPLTSVGGTRCAVCHAGTPSHTTATPSRPSNAIHKATANCRTCHSPLRHPDNGMTCTICHQ